MKNMLNNIIDKIPEMVGFKLMIAALISAVPAVPISLFESLTGWYIDNQVFLSLVFAAVAIDHVLGSFVHYVIKKDFSAKKNLYGLLIKGFAVCAGYVLFEMIHQIVDDVQFVASYFKVILQLTVMLYPVMSALKNLSIITAGKFPPAIWFKKFESFNKDLSLIHFKDEKSNDHGAADAGSDELPQPEENPSE